MIVISSNIRGLNNWGKQRYLMERLKKEKPQIMLLQETNITGEKLEEVLSKMKPRYEAVATDVKGSAGGIAILWNPTEVKADY